MGQTKRILARSRLRPTARERVALVLLLVLQACMLAWIDWRTAPTWDEWGHLPSGLYHLQYGVFEPYCVNPPLVRMVAALPLVAIGEGIRWMGFPLSASSRPEWLLRSVFLQTKGERCFELFSLARMALIPGCWLGTYLLWSIGRRFYGAASGWLAAVLWTFSPMALGFGATVAPDVWSATFGFLAAWRFYIWLTMRTWRAAIWLAIATALALLCKSTWIILPPILVLLWLVDLIRHGSQSLRKDFQQCLVGAFICWLTIHVAYDFRGALRPLGSFEFHSRALTGLAGPGFAEGNRFSNTWLGKIPAPLPAAYVQGIDIQKADLEGQRDSYLFGVWQDHGWWYYYLVGIPLKEPVALWGLLALLIVGAALGLQRAVRWREFLLLTPGVFLLVFVSSQTGFSHHLRYVLPFYLCMYLFVSRCVAVDSRMIRIAGGVLCLWYAGSSAAILPHSYAFFSEAVGGADQGWRYLSDSNLDWGQDLLILREWAQKNTDKRPIYLLYSPDMLDFPQLGIDGKNGKPLLVDGVPGVAGWWAVFATPMTEPGLEWFREQPATIRLSPSLKLIEVTARELDDLRAPNRQGASR